MARHYIYALIDPRSASAFYVGKGVSARRFHHFKSAPVDKRKNAAKLRVLEELAEAGLTPQAVVLSWHETQEEAYAAEKAAIARIGLENLTNQNAGGAGKLVGGTTTLSDAEPVSRQALTPREEKFCRCIVEGMNHADAYRAAYTAENMKPNTIYNRAKDVLARGLVKDRIAALRGRVEKKLEITVESQIARIGEAIEQALSTDQVSAALKGMELQSKLLDQFPAQKNINENRNITEIAERLLEGRERVARLRVVGGDD